MYRITYVYWKPIDFIKIEEIEKIIIDKLYPLCYNGIKLRIRGHKEV